MHFVWMFEFISKCSSQCIFYFALPRMRFIFSHTGGVLKTFYLLFIFSLCFIYDLSLPQPLHLNIWFKTFSASIQAYCTFMLPHAPFLSVCHSHYISCCFPPVPHVLLLSQSGCRKFLLKCIILNSGLVEEEDEVNGRRGWSKAKEGEAQKEMEMERKQETDFILCNIQFLNDKR